MPEGHTIHRVARDHNRWFQGEPLRVSSPQGRFRSPARRLTGHQLEQVEAHGKHLFYHWDDQTILHIHLGLYGKFRLHPSPPPKPVGAVRLRVVGCRKSFDLNGPNTCSLITRSQYELKRARLGPDPLRSDADAEDAWNRIQSSRTAIGKLLLDQSVMAGVGNIFRCEALFLEGLHPNRPGQSIGRSEFDALWTRITELLRIGVRYNRIITSSPQHIGKPRSRMRKEERLLCYQMENCVRCGHRIDCWELGARKIFACPTCQV